MPGSDGREAIRAALDPAYFSQRHFAWTPYPYQQRLLDAVILQGKRRIAWVAGRRVGKTEAVANLTLQLAVRRPGVEVVNFAPSFRQAKILSNGVRTMLRGCRWEEHIVVDNVGELRLGFGEDEHGKPRESKILTLSMSGKVRGEGADVLIVDESAFVDPEDYRNKALPFIADRPDAIVIHISTVWAEDDHFMDAVHRFEELPHGMTMVTPTREKPGVSEEMLAEFRASMLESEFKREYECELVPEGGVFPREELGRVLEDYDLLGLKDLSRLEVKPRHRYVVGVDWGKFQDQSVVALVEQPTQHKVNPARLVLLEAYEPGPEDEHHYTTILQDVKRLAHHVDAHKVIPDQGEGAHQNEVLKRELGARVEPYRFTSASREFLVDHARFLVEKSLVRLPLEPDTVRRAFANVQVVDDAYQHPSRRLKDVFDAVALALTGMADANSQGRMTLLAATPPARRRRPWRHVR